MPIFASPFSTDPRKQQQPIGATTPKSPYNVPINQIRPGENQVNIQGGGDLNQNDAFAAFSRLYTPFLQNQMQLLKDTGARPLGGPVDTRLGAAPGPAPLQYGPNDINAALMNMFQRQEDIGTLSKYQGFSPSTRRSPALGY